MADFIAYFDADADFNLHKIRQRIEAPGVLEQLIKRAEEQRTHPVTEFLKDLFRELGQSGETEWSGEL